MSKKDVYKVDIMNLNIDIMENIKEKTVAEMTQYLSNFILDERRDRIAEVLKERTRHITIVVEDLFQTQNISAVMRSCECFGIQDIHIVEGENEFSIHNTISMGSDKWLTRHHYPPAPNNMVDCISNLKAKGYEVVATLPDEKSCFIEQLPVDKPLAFLFGTELTGLSEDAIKHADRTVKIPMYGFTESFNISNSVAIIAHYFIEKIRNSGVAWQLPANEHDELLLEWYKKTVKASEEILERFKSN